MRQGLGPRRCRRTEEGLAANHSGIWGRCRAALVAARGRRGRLQGGRTAGGKEQEGAMDGRWRAATVLVGGGCSRVGQRRRRVAGRRARAGVDSKWWRRERKGLGRGLYLPLRRQCWWRRSVGPPLCHAGGAGDWVPRWQLLRRQVIWRRNIVLRRHGPWRRQTG